MGLNHSLKLSYTTNENVKMAQSLEKLLKILSTELPYDSVNSFKVIKMYVQGKLGIWVFRGLFLMGKRWTTQMENKMSHSHPEDYAAKKRINWYTLKHKQILKNICYCFSQSQKATYDSIHRKSPKQTRKSMETESKWVVARSWEVWVMRLKELMSS